MTEKKIADQFCYLGLGFPVTLKNVPMVNIRGIWTPDVDYNQLQRNVALILCFRKVELTGDEIQFLRKYLGLSLLEFGQSLGVSHPAVIKWERTGSQPTKMTRTTDLCLRLFVLDQLHVDDRLFRSTFRHYNWQIATERQEHELQLDASKPFNFEECG